MSGTGANTLPTASAYDVAIQRLAGGQFISRFKEQPRQMFATIYGGPFFAITRLAPELYTKSDINLLFADVGGWYAQAGGRWLTLYAKALQPTHKHTMTVCTSRRPAYKKDPKPILFQPPQHLLQKAWGKHLQSLDTLPDLTILPIPDDFEHIVSAAELLLTITAGHKILISCHLHMEAIIVGALLRAYGFKTSPVIGFDLAEGEPQHFAQGAWWLSVITPTKKHATRPTREVIDALSQTYHCLRSLISQGKAKKSTALIAATIAKRANVSVEGKDFRAVHVPPFGDIDLDTGRFFNTNEDTNAEHLVWNTQVTRTELLSKVPDEDDGHSADEDRLNLMRWVTNALAEHDNGEPDESAEPDELEAVSVSHATEPQRPPEADDAANTGTSCSDKTSSDTPPTSQWQRPRLSRHAGAINVLALAAQLGRTGQPTEKTFEATRTCILRWLNHKGFRTTDSTGNNHIESADGEVTIESDGTRIWSMRFDDRRSMEQGAIWRVEATLINGTQPAIGLRLIQVRSSEDAPAPIASGVPQVVADIAKDIGLTDAGTALLNTVTHLAGEEGALRLIQLLLNSERIQPVIVIAGDIDATVDRLAKRLTGVGHIVCIDASVSHQLIRQLGRERSVYGHAVRLYRPGFSTKADPYMHPVWPLKGNQLPKWLANDLFEEACATSTGGDDLDERVPSFQTIRQHLASQRLQSSEERLAALRDQAANAAASKDEQISQLKAIRAELESAITEHRNKSEELSHEVADLREELRATRHERDEARKELRRKRYHFDSQWSDEPDDDTELTDQSYYPDTWDDLEDWLDIYSDDKLILLPSAAKAARESSFKNIPLAYKALEYLVCYYVPMRTRDTQDTAPYQASQQALAELGLELSNVGTALDDRRYKQDYHRQYEGQDIWLDQHLKAGVGFDPATIFRLYFWYDTDAAKVVVGHMPTHLTNRTTHSG